MNKTIRLSLSTKLVTRGQSPPNLIVSTVKYILQRHLISTVKPLLSGHLRNLPKLMEVVKIAQC